jgi:hypothetical protein
MHRLVLIAAVAALAAGCTNPCQELGDRICKCPPTGTSTDTCKQQVSNVYDSVKPTNAQDAHCSDLLDSCDSHGADFCEWLATADAKAACGLAYPPPQ